MGQPTTERDAMVSRAELQAMQVEYDRKLVALTEALARYRRPRSRRRRFLLLLPLALLLALVPVSIRAANPFTDLTGGVHDANIDAIYNAGITTGCVPNARYCPTDLVTRQEMASFLARTAGLGTNPPVANAKTVGGYAPSALIRAGQGISRYTRDTNEFTVASVFNSGASPDPIASVGIAAPGAGFVVVNATLGVSIEPSNTGGTSSNTVGFARLRDTSVAGTTGSVSPLLSTATGNGSQATTLSPTYVFPVAAGAHSFVLETQKSGTGTVKVFDGVVTALFVPFGSGGAGTLEEGQP